MLRVIVGSLAGIGLAMSMVSSSAGVEQPPPEPPSSFVTPPSSANDAQSEDLATFAKERGLPVEKVVEQYSGQEDFSRLVAQVDDIDANALVEASWNPESTPHAEFVLTKSADPAAVAPLSKSSDAQVHVADLPSRQQRESAVEGAYHASGSRTARAPGIPSRPAPSCGCRTARRRRCADRRCSSVRRSSRAPSCGARPWRSTARRRGTTRASSPTAAAPPWTSVTSAST